MKFQAGQNIIDKIRGKNAHKNQIKKFSDSLLEIINRDEPHQVSNGEDVYAYEYSWKVKFLAKLFHTFCDKFNISLIHQNKFGYSLYYPAKNVSEATIERILSFDFPVDSLPEFTLFNKYPRQYNTIFDVGANKGHSSCFFSKIAQKVFAFEPVPYLVDELKQNVTLNNCKNIEIIEKAVSNQSGKTRFNLYDSDGHNSLLRHDQSKFKKSIDVDMITLDEFCKNKGISHIDLLSIDVEGYEYNVLQGGGELLATKAVDLILFEVVRGYLSDEKILELLDFIRSFGYEIYTLQLKKFEWSDLKFHQDLLAVKDGNLKKYLMGN